MTRATYIVKADSGKSPAVAAGPQVRRAATDIHPILGLQSSIGNRAVQRLIESVMETDAEGEWTAGELVHGVLNAPGDALDPETRARMESGFGFDFSGVRVHTGSGAAAAAKAIHAQAFTSGEDIVFGEGRYAPGTEEGERLLAHESAHVVQQAAGPVAGTPTPDGALSISDPDDAFEQAAEDHAGKVIGNMSATAASAAPGATPVQRSWLDDIGDAVSDAGSAIASGVGSVVDAGESVASDVASGVSNVAGDVWSGAKSVAGDVASGVSDVAGDVWSGAKSVAGDVASGVSDVAGDVWSGAKSVAGDVVDFGKDVYGQMKEDAKYVQKGVGWVDKGVDWLEDEAKSGTHWLADKAEGIPVLEQLAGAGESIVDTSVDITGGALKGVTGMAGGLLSAAADPVDTAKALYTMSEHIPGVGLPAKLLGGAYDLATTDKSLSDVADETLNPMSDLKYWGNMGKALWNPLQKSIDAGKPGEALGQAGIQIAAMFTGAGEAGVAGELGEGAAIAQGSELAEGAELAQGAELGQGAELAEGAEIGEAGALEPPAGALEPPVEPVEPPGPAEIPPEAQAPTSGGGSPPSGGGGPPESVGPEPPEESFAGLIDNEAFSNDPAIIDRLSRARNFDIGGYKSLTAKGDYGRVGDLLDSDEALQNAFVRDRMGVGRTDPLLEDNPAIALDENLHGQINNLKIPQMQNMSAEQVLGQHIDQLKSFTPDYIWRTLERESQSYISRLGL